MRLTLALSALLIIYIDPTEPDRFVTVTYATLGLYSLYSAAVLYGTIRGRPLVPVGAAHWVDTCWYLVLISLSSGTNSIFFLFFFFSVLIAAFRVGFEEGVRVTVVSVALFTVIGLLTLPPGSEFEPHYYLLRPLYLAVLGYMFSYVGGSEVTFKRRLALLKEVNTLSNPRFGVDQTLGSILERVRDFYGADVCLLVTADEDSSSYLIHRAEGRQAGGVARAEPLPERMASLLLALPPEYAVAFSRRPRWLGGPSCHVWDGAKGARFAADVGICESLADLLDSVSFVTVPVGRYGAPVGRLYLASHGRQFRHGDVEFLRQLVEHVYPVIDNIRLLDNLASEAGEQERRKISLDIHDSVVQPYIGLKMGLEALRRRAQPDNPLLEEINMMIAQAEASLSDLRGYVRGVKDGAAGRRGDVLVPAVRRHASKFGQLYGIRVDVTAESDIFVSDRLAAEVFQVVREGLTNVRRHSNAARASVGLLIENKRLVVRIENESQEAADVAPFSPRSITERAAALGGRAHVERRAGSTAVIAEIPL